MPPRIRVPPNAPGRPPISPPDAAFEGGSTSQTGRVGVRGQVGRLSKPLPHRRPPAITSRGRPDHYFPDLASPPWIPATAAVLDGEFVAMVDGRVPALRSVIASGARQQGRRRGSPRVRRAVDRRTLSGRRGLRGAPGSYRPSWTWMTTTGRRRRGSWAMPARCMTPPGSWGWRTSSPTGFAAPTVAGSVPLAGSRFPISTRATSWSLGDSHCSGERHGLGSRSSATGGPVIDCGSRHSSCTAHVAVSGSGPESSNRWSDRQPPSRTSLLASDFRPVDPVVKVGARYI